jgi:hypothetical protein
MIKTSIPPTLSTSWRMWNCRSEDLVHCQYRGQHPQSSASTSTSSCMTGQFYRNFFRKRPYHPPEACSVARMVGSMHSLLCMQILREPWLVGCMYNVGLAQYMQAYGLVQHLAVRPRPSCASPSPCSRQRSQLELPRLRRRSGARSLGSYQHPRCRHPRHRGWPHPPRPGEVTLPSRSPTMMRPTMPSRSPTMKHSRLWWRGALLCAIVDTCQPLLCGGHESHVPDMLLFFGVGPSTCPAIWYCSLPFRFLFFSYTEVTKLLLFCYLG